MKIGNFKKQLKKCSNIIIYTIIKFIIIYYNPSAFSDFANIETQEDVYSFNSKYDVSLVLPFNTETT